jgi:hypothetical protein
MKAAELAYHSTTTKTSASINSSKPSSASVFCAGTVDNSHEDATPDWDSDERLFTFTRGRFLYDEDHQMAQRTVRFSMSELARAAAASIGADRCVHVQKCPDGLYNKAYLLRMDDGQEVIGKVPNPNAGLPHYTTASEVATMDFIGTPRRSLAPLLYSTVNQ